MIRSRDSTPPRFARCKQSRPTRADAIDRATPVFDAAQVDSLRASPLLRCGEPVASVPSLTHDCSERACLYTSERGLDDAHLDHCSRACRLDGAGARRRFAAGFVQRAQRPVSARPRRRSGDLPADGAECTEGPAPARRRRQRARQGTVRHDPRREGRLVRSRFRRPSPASTTTGSSSTALNVNDPGSETFFGWGRQTSGIEVPETGADYYDARDVPHGEVRRGCTSPRSPARGGGPTSTRRPATTPTSRRAIRCSTSSTAPARTRRLDQAGPREPDPRQPDRRRKGEADDRRHGHGLCDQARRDARAGRRPATPQMPERVRGRRRHRSDPDDRRAPIARLPIATTGPWPGSRWAAGRRCRSRRSTSTSSPGSARSARRCATST